MTGGRFEFVVPFWIGLPLPPLARGVGLSAAEAGSAESGPAAEEETGSAEGGSGARALAGGSSDAASVDGRSPAPVRVVGAEDEAAAGSGLGARARKMPATHRPPITTPMPAPTPRRREERRAGTGAVVAPQDALALTSVALGWGPVR